MRAKDEFSTFHPVVNFVYFALVIGFSMFFMHPVCLTVSLVSSIAYAVNLSGKKAVKFSLLYMLPILLLTVSVNPAFNHEGATILAYLPSGNPLTLESIIYGLCAGALLISVIMWFRCYTEVITSDKFIYLFGRIIPSLSLILSMTLRFVPKFAARIRSVSEAQRLIGRDVTNGSIFSRAKNAVRILSVMLTWSLESAVETADSMKSRGYGLKGRTAFSIYRFDGRDKSAVLWLAFCGAFVLCGAVSGGFYYRCFPTVKSGAYAPLSVSFFVIYAAMCMTPVIINLWEGRKWKRLKSAI